MEGLEVRLTALRDGVVDIHTAEGAVGRAQVKTCLKCSLHYIEETKYSWICRKKAAKNIFLFYPLIPSLFQSICACFCMLFLCECVCAHVCVTSSLSFSGMWVQSLFNCDRYLIRKGGGDLTQPGHHAHECVTLQVKYQQLPYAD